MKPVYAIFLTLAALTASAFAQRAPRVAFVYPAGGRVGTTLQVVVGGQNLLGVTNAWFSGEGLQAEVVECRRPLNPNEFNLLRERLKALQDRFQASRQNPSGTNVWTADDAAEMARIRERILKDPPNRAATPAMIDRVTLKVSIATNAAGGEHDLRLATLGAMSNPLKFLVGELPEAVKPVSQPANPAQARAAGRPGAGGTPKYETRVTLPITVNGQILPGGVDRYRFYANRGQQLIVAAEARDLIPYLADAVPGWFAASLTLFDAKGKEWVSDQRFRFKPDPVLHFDVPQDGEYVVEIHDSIYRGREDFVYRLTLGELPFVTGVSPLGGRAGERSTVTLTGWNLKEKSLVRDNVETPPAVVSLTGRALNEAPFAVDDLPEVEEKGAGGTAETAQALTLPVIVNGRIGQPGERNVYRFNGRAGQPVVVEVFARRLDSPLDSLLRLTDAAGRELASNDDFEDKGSGLETHHADSYLSTTLPADGVYYVHLNDTQSQGGPEFAYRLRLSEPRPDFALRLTPASVTLRPGASVPLTVYALRRDGFTNAIDLRLKEPPPGFSLGTARIPENQDKTQVTLKAPARSVGTRPQLVLEGTAHIAGQAVTRSAVPAEDMMQAFAYRHLVPAREWGVWVVGNPRPAANAIKILSATPVDVPIGSIARVRFATPSPGFAGRFRFELKNPPAGIRLDRVAPAADGIEVVVAAAGTLEPGASGQLVVEMLPKAPPAAPNQPQPTNAPKRTVAGTLPPIPYRIVGR